MKKACVMGHPVAHSRSPMIHGYWLKTLAIPGTYELKDLTPEQFVPFITHLSDNGYVGGNVTVPHKEAAYRTVSSRDAASDAVGAVNVLWLENGKLMGGNSDVHGFIANLDDRAPRPGEKARPPYGRRPGHAAAAGGIRLSQMVRRRPEGHARAAFHRRGRHRRQDTEVIWPRGGAP